AMYNNYQYNVAIKTLLDPARGGSGVISIPGSANLPTPINNANQGPVTDYAANGLLMGWAKNVAQAPGPSPATYSYSAPRYAYTMANITGGDGTSNTIFVGIKSLPTSMYTTRGVKPNGTYAQFDLPANATWGYPDMSGSGSIRYATSGE